MASVLASKRDTACDNPVDRFLPLSILVEELISPDGTLAESFPEISVSELEEENLSSSSRLLLHRRIFIDATPAADPVDEIQSDPDESESESPAPGHGRSQEQDRQ